MIIVIAHCWANGSTTFAQDATKTTAPTIAASPYENPPPVEAPYYRVRYAAGSQPGELVYPVAYTIWIPPTASPLRGVIVHQHGCGEGSCKSGQTGAFDLHWQALAHKHNCALLSPAYEQPQEADCQLWCDPRHGSAAKFQQALADLGTQAKRPELATVPWALWGHSGGGHWAGGLLLLHPERVAAVWLRSGVPLFEKVDGRNIRPYDLNDASLQVPVMCNFGTQEGFATEDGKFAGVWPSNRSFFEKLRGAGGLVGVAVDPLTSHECGNQRYLAIPWLDACLTARLPRRTGDPLQAINTQHSWLAPLTLPTEDRGEPVAAAEFSGPLGRSIWLPNATIARAWSEYVNDTAVGDNSPPPAPTNVKLEGDTLTWQAAADVESGLAHFIIEHNGVEVAKVAGPPNRFGRQLFQGLQYSDTPSAPLVAMRYQLQPDRLASPQQYTVRAVNTVGLISP